MKKRKSEIITGRFIPNRKTSNLQVSHQLKNENLQNVNVYDHTKDYSQEGSISVPKLYKSHILGIQNAIPENPLSYSC